VNEEIQMNTHTETIMKTSEFPPLRAAVERLATLKADRQALDAQAEEDRSRDKSARFHWEHIEREHMLGRATAPQLEAASEAQKQAARAVARAADAVSQNQQAQMKESAHIERLRSEGKALAVGNLRDAYRASIAELMIVLEQAAHVNLNVNQLYAMLINESAPAGPGVPEMRWHELLPADDTGGTRYATWMKKAKDYLGTESN
jgi:hypothetical protein